MKIGDLVVRKSYNKDSIFRIIDIKIDDTNKEVAMLKGIAFRILADSAIEDLEIIEIEDLKKVLMDTKVETLIAQSMMDVKKRGKLVTRALNHASAIKYGIPGKVLQIDGDKEYLKVCLDVYTELGIPAVGVAIPEDKQHKEVLRLLEKHNPDILIITGHDAFTSKKGNSSDLNNYRNSMNFIKTVKQARKWQPNLDNLVIFAGACQSNYEELIKAGANYASSPARIMIHALDPVFVVEKIACSRLDVIVPLEEIIEQTVTGIRGVGGLETRGKFRWAMPRPNIS